MDFELIPVRLFPCPVFNRLTFDQYEDIVLGHRLGAGSFGSVYNGILTVHLPTYPSHFSAVNIRTN